MSTDVQEAPSVWRQLGGLLEYEHNQINVRFDRVDRDILDLKVGLAANTKRLDGVEQRLDGVEERLGSVEGQLGRLETATVNGFNRIQADIERLAGLIKRDELKPRPRRP